jgi:hypothetical protein
VWKEKGVEGPATTQPHPMMNALRDSRARDSQCPRPGVNFDQGGDRRAEDIDGYRSLSDPNGSPPRPRTRIGWASGLVNGCVA